jgi:hypothetical protein
MLEERTQEEHKKTNEENNEEKQETKDDNNKDKKQRKQQQPRFRFKIDHLTNAKNGLRLFYEATKNMKILHKPDAKEVSQLNINLYDRLIC